MRTTKIAIFVALIVGVIGLILIAPRKSKCDYQPYFYAINNALKAQSGGASAGIIDLDRLDQNINVVCERLGSAFKLRLVTKSLPSLPLLKYIMAKANTDRLMVFSEPFIAELLITCDPDSLDILLGKPLPADALERLTAIKGWNTINWLIDTKERLHEYLVIAQKQDTILHISLEIDVGLHRGGFATMEQFADAIEIIKANSHNLKLTGLMGYDGHVPYVPLYINKDRSIRNAFVGVQQHYSQFVDELRKHYDFRFISSLTFDSGGSRTYLYYPEYHNSSPVNDIAMGSGFLAPAEFSELIKIGHQPALFLCSPVLKKVADAKLPFAEMVSPLVNWWDPNLKVSYYMLGGGWAGEQIAPEGLKRNRFWDENDKGYSNLLPNQAILCSSDDNNVNVGDFVFYHAWEGDGMLTFSKVMLIRQKRIVGTWDTYKGGN